MKAINQRLINDVAVGVVFVQGQEPELQMTNAEILSAAAEIQDGLSMLSGLEPEACISWAYKYEQVNLTQPIFPNAPWKGLPLDFYIKKIDAALWRESNGKTYLFQGSQYVRLTGSTMDAGYPKPIAGNWKGLPAEFESGIDAAFWHRERDKIYMFKGDQYVRLTETEMDAGYPKPIEGNWKDLPADFTSGIDAVFMHPGTHKIYMFQGSRYARLTGTQMDTGYPKPIAGHFKGLPDYFESGVHAALWRGDNDRLYLFGSKPRNNLNQYVRYTDMFQEVDSGYPKYVGGLDAGDTEAMWRDPAQSALGVGPGREGFEQYVKDLVAELGTDWGLVAFVTRYPSYWGAYASTPKIVMRWKAGGDNFDRVFAHETGHMFGAPDEYASSGCGCADAGRFFRAKNGNCENCASAISMDAGYPKPIAGPWKGLPASFQGGIDAAVWREDNGRVYMFKGDQYVRLTDVTVDAGYPKPIEGHWKGLPSSFTAGIDAAVWRRSNGKIYLFKGSQYVRLTDTTMDEGYPRPIAGNWKGLPSHFEDGIEAALWRESNDKLYFFKGSQYVRLTETEMDAGYPKPIAGHWRDLPPSFTGGISAALMHRARKTVYLFSGAEYVRMSNGVPCLMSGNSPTVCGSTPLHVGWEAFLTHIDAALYRPDNGKTYLFSGAWYVRYSNINDGIDEGYPKRIASNWQGLPPDFQSHLDAALWRESNQKVYLFKGNQYARLSGSQMDPGYPRPIAGHWKGIPASFEEGIDGAFQRLSNGKIYFFKGSQYVRLTETEMDAGYPAPLTPNWTALPASFASGIDAALMRGDTGQIYFFKDRRYLRYSNVANGPDDGYPKWINSGWMPFPRA